MGSRRKAREVSLQILFQYEFSSHLNLDQNLQLFRESFTTEPELLDYSALLVRGVRTNSEAIDNKIQAASAHWKVKRMALVDLNIMRIAVYEMFYMTPPLNPKIAINEAVDICKKYGSTDSSAFVNGVLDQMVKAI